MSEILNAIASNHALLGGVVGAIVGAVVAFVLGGVGSLLGQYRRDRRIQRDLLSMIRLELLGLRASVQMRTHKVVRETLLMAQEEEGLSKKGTQDRRHGSEIVADARARVHAESPPFATDALARIMPQIGILSAAVGQKVMIAFMEAEEANSATGSKKAAYEPVSRAANEALDAVELAQRGPIGHGWAWIRRRLKVGGDEDGTKT